MANVTLEQQLQRKILVIDGAMGTMIQRANLSAADFGGEAYEGCNEYLTLTAPHIIRRIHEAYLEAGADIIETNTFGATRIVLDEYGLGHLALELNIEAAKLAKQTAESFSTPDWPRFVAGSMGPTTKTLSVTGGATFEELVAAYEEQARGLLLGGVDLLLLETCQDTLNVKAGFLGISKAFEAVGRRVPLMISGTIEPMGTTLAGQAIDAFFISVRHMKPIAVGLNCATGPEFMTDHLRTLASLADTAVSCYPNAGLPDEEGRYHETPEMLAEKIRRFAEKGWINIVGGCCGTTPDHIRAIAEAVRDLPPRAIPSSFDVHAVSGIEALIYDETMRPLFVGERTNVIGSRKFKRLIAEGKYEEAAEIARAQVKNGAHVIDICLADPDRDELHDMEQFVREVVKKVKVPLVIDSTDERVIERALTYSQGKAIINSINLEDGEERFAKVVPLLHKYGAAVVVGTIDEQGMAVTAERKLEIALRSYDLLVNRYGVPARDIIFDPLVFPVGTGDEQYIGAANETIKGIRLIKERLPHCLTMLGISNVSFGLPPAGREVLNSVFLYRCTQAGLDYAIVNTEKLERFASIPEEEVRMAEALLFDTSDETLNTFIEFYRSKITAAKPAEENLSLEERLARYVIEGSKDGLIPDLEKALETYSDPLSIINGPLMAGMDEVGRLFNNNQLIVAEVLQSAEVMKAAVAFLEPYMEKKEGSTKGKVILATVKGDVHDIGKNLVDIILSNNGYEVIDLGIKVAPQQLIEAVREHQPDIIGLSGLLVKSAQQMVVTAQDLRQAGISTPILVGGAALTRKFTENKIAPEYDGVVLYAKDAMDGLALANQIQQGEIDYKKKETAESEPTRPTAVAATVKSNVSTDVPVYIPADLERHVLRNVPLDHILPYVNWQMVLGHHLGLKGKVKRLLEEKDEKALALKAVVDELVAEAKERGWIQPAGVYRFFPAQSDGNRVYVYDPVDRKTVLETFDFPRQPRAPYLCLADYLKSKESGEMDYVGLFAVTAGHGVHELAQRWKEEGEFLKSHAIQALALEIAEGFAERIHQIMRDRWGFPDDPDFTMEERFAAKYQGQRYSFGYPACPNLEDQEKLFRLLHPEDIGIRLTDGYMMEPEASVSAIVFAHPEARYFNVL
ncbi:MULTISPECIES: methionine synthase [Geobacillus]|uniref:Methionine synthase n=1 Tax=Geobacillus stearothermophilus TaxID=1422 RepID=A0ABQ7HFN9_GEOSE|nr:methionine synthase [Geobacillus stearothermophilus]KAF6511024.1 5-methyltetrahydrofolate--homocysteine methyltransferase [Geobacillus stearothermophilus]KMY61787.1 methionine synthase [Geobacillus stearothermophilus]KMY62440.1 methionine synthase [Geobacillus stearothermophilus]KMY63740.1 methionine synthase [Geobacillus stearothermophilus]MED3731848.1 methionine synthase [Geobacillus stearothermophilus]